MIDNSSFVNCSFFERDVDAVALDLIGRTIVVCTSEGNISEAMIVETEAYGDASDPASHAAFRPGGRAAIMKEAPGLAYVYAAYGVHPCFNIVTGPTGEAGAVLLRGIVPASTGVPVLGPGKSSRALGIDLNDHGSRCGAGRFQISNNRASLHIVRTPRIGITRSVDTPWRFAAILG